jgi:L-asparagine transporter-like permease
LKKHPGNKGQGKTSNSGNMKWWQLSLIGIGCTIGTGYFLGSVIGIHLTGSSIVISFALAAAGTLIVFLSLAKMTASDPQEGSFCYYAGKAFGGWAALSCGWSYWCSNILIMGSQLTAISLLSKFWFENVPLWVFSAIYAALAIVVVLAGAKGFNKMENVFAVVKTAAITMFIILALLVLFGGISTESTYKPFQESFLHDGLKGLWASLIYAFYAFGGIEVIGLMAMQLKKKEEAAKAGTVMLIGLAIVYIISLLLACSLVGTHGFHTNESPFVTALEKTPLGFFPHVFNAAVIIAGFSTLCAALFAVTNLLVTLAKDKDAPQLFAKKLKFKDLPLASMLLAAVGLLASIITALLLPGKIYEYITTAAGLLLLYNWLFILASAWKNEKYKIGNKVLSVIGAVLLLAGISGTAVEAEVRPGLYASGGAIVLILIIGIWVKRKKSQNAKHA